MFLTSKRVLGLTALLAFAALAFALISQHALGMQPCAWCVLQRMICLAIGVVAGIGWLARDNRIVPGLAMGASFLLAMGGAVAAWYQHTVAAKLFTCDLTFADRVVTGSGLDQALPQVFGVYATCADSAVSLLGVQYEIWALILFVAMAAINVLALAKPRA